MGLLCRNAWGRLAVLAAIAAVLGACEAGPGAKAQPDPVKIKDVVFEKVGTEREIPLGDKFSGEELTYTATSSNMAVATVEVDNDDDILTVAAAGAGEATIEVTAADSQDRTASQTFKVTVKATTSEPEPGAPTVKDGAPTSVDFEAGESTTKTVTLSQVFEGDDLTYSAPESDDTDVAIASISNRVLIIRAGDPGEAAITVTAMNAKGEADHEITVTVPDPEETGQPGEQGPTTPSATLTIKLGESAKRTLSPGQTLKEPADGGVKVESSPDGETGNVWLITATKKGTWTITIYSGAAQPEKVGSFLVEVPNNRPVRKPNDPHPEPLSAQTRIPDRDTTYDTTRYKTGKAPYKTTNLNLDRHFTDADTDADSLSSILRYSIGSISDDSVLIDAKDGFVSIDDTGTHEGALKFEVLEEVRKNFTVSIYAHDDSGDRSQRPVVLTFLASDIARLTPSGRIYKPEQGSNGALNKEGALKVGPRIGVPHTLIFESLDGETGFAFAKDLRERWKEYLVETVPDATEGPPTSVTGSQDPATDTSVGVGVNYFTLKSVGAVEAEWADPNGLNGDPTVTFKLTRKGSGSITIEYTLFRSSHKITTDEPANNEKKTKVSDRKTLTVSVVSCSSPPDPIDDCH